MPALHRFAITIGIGFIAHTSFAQNCITISMPDTANGCPDSVTSVVATLDVPAGLTVIDTNWIPTNGISDVNSLTPTFTGVNPQVYTLQVFTLTDTDHIYNGDFSLGNSGFVSGYILQTSGTYPGHYAVTKNLAPLHTSYPVMGDHTTGDGYMMVIDGSLDPTIPFWCQTVTVVPKTYYVFSFWATTILHPPPKVKVTINNREVLTVGITDTIAYWIQYHVTWYSGTATSADICMYSTIGIAGGNDFVMDDLHFDNICLSSHDLYVNVCSPKPVPHIFGMPKAFTPNGDGANDVLYAHGDNIKTFEMKIYNRWGKKVFETTDINKGWDGTDNGTPQPEETYVYAAKITYTDKKSEKKEGYVLLMR